MCAQDFSQKLCQKCGRCVYRKNKIFILERLSEVSSIGVEHVDTSKTRSVSVSLELVHYLINEIESIQTIHVMEVMELTKSFCIDKSPLLVLIRL